MIIAYLIILVPKVIELPLKHPELFESLGISQPKVLISSVTLMINDLYYNAAALLRMCSSWYYITQGVLLYGPPGTGKTLLARAVAHHTDCTFIRVSGSELVQKYIGEGSRMVRELFVMARYVLSIF